MADKQQAADGTWSKIGATHGESIDAWAIRSLLSPATSPGPAGQHAEAGGLAEDRPGKQLKKAIEYIRDNAHEGGERLHPGSVRQRPGVVDAKDDSTFEVVKKVLERLDRRERRPDWKRRLLPGGGQSLSYARGDGLTVETTALAVLAMIRTASSPPASTRR